MAFELPEYNSLSTEQLDYINLRTDMKTVIQGSPGTGKTVIAIYRAAQMRNKKVLLLVYNRPLMLYLDSAIAQLNLKNCVVSTWHSWLSSFYSLNLKKRVPEIAKFQPDWQQVKIDFQTVDCCYDHIIVDEGQDFPIELIQVLAGITKGMTCCVDTNQAIFQNTNGIIPVLEQLGIFTPFTLDRNYRNTKEIADAAKLFWTPIDGGMYAGATRSGKKPTVIHCKNFVDQTQKICNVILNNQGRTIGVFTESKGFNQQFCDLQASLQKRVPVQMYKTFGKGNNINFNTPGVKLLTYGTNKGLQFDIVILARFNMLKSDGNSEVDTNRAFVAMTRACDDLYICEVGDYRGNKWIDTMSQINNNPHLF